VQLNGERLTVRHAGTRAVLAGGSSMRSATVAILVGSTLASACADPRAETLRFAYRTGDAWLYRVSEEQRSTAVRTDPQDVPLEEPVRSSEIRSWTLRADVREVDSDGNATIDWTFTRVQVSVNRRGTFEWDSELDSVPQQLRRSADLGVVTLGPLVGKTVTVVTSPLGEIRETRGVDALIAAARTLVQPMAGAVGFELQSMLGDPATTRLYGEPVTFSSDRVAPGDDWIQRGRFIPGALTAVDITSTLDSVVAGSEGRWAVISHEAPIDEAGGDTARPGGSSTVQILGRTGVTEFSLDLGLVLSTSAVTKRSIATMHPDLSWTRATSESITSLQLLGPADREQSRRTLTTRLPEPATVVDSAAHPEGVTEWVLANGLRVLLKPGGIERGRIFLLGVSPGGESVVDDEEVIQARAAAQSAQAWDVGPLTPLGLRHALAGRSVAVVTQLSDRAEAIRGSAPTEDIEGLLQLVYLRMTATRADSFAFEVWRAEARDARGRAEATTSGRVTDAWARLIGLSDHPRRRPSTSATLDQLELQRVHAIYRERFGDGGDFTFNIVGDFDPTTIRPLVERYLGGLPSSGRRESWGDDGFRVPDGVIEETSRADDPWVTNTRILFHGPSDDGVEQRVAGELVALALQGRIRRELGLGQSEAYRVGVRSASSLEPRETYEIMISLALAPERSDGAVQRVLEEVQRVRARGFDSEEAAAARAELLRRHDASLFVSLSWSNAMATAALRGEPPTESILGWRAAIEALDDASLGAAAATLLSTDRYVRLTLEETGGWIEASSAQERFDAETGGGFFPIRIEGRRREGPPEFRMAFASIPPNSNFQAYWGQDPQAFATRQATFARQGYQRIWTHAFDDPAGGRRIQAVWWRPLPVGQGVVVPVPPPGIGTSTTNGG
jgi:predicted Zn-dependent peptidase